MAKIITGSLQTGLGTTLKGLINNETSAARTFKHEQTVSWYNQQNYMATALKALTGLTTSTRSLNVVDKYAAAGPSTQVFPLGVIYKNAPASPATTGFFIAATFPRVAGTFSWRLQGVMSRIVGAWGGPSSRGINALGGRGNGPTQQNIWVHTSGTSVKMQYYIIKAASSIGGVTTVASTLEVWGASTPIRTALYALGR